MHNCKAIRSRVVDLLSAGPNCDLPEEVSVELSNCEACEREFHTLSNTMRLATRGLDAAMPADGYWPVYHEKLQEKLLNIDVPDGTRIDSVPFRFPRINRLFTSSVMVRTPVAVSLLLLFALSLAALAWTLRSSKTEVISQAPAVIQVPVPVVQEKIVEKVVYVPKKSGPRQKQTVNRRAPANDINAFSQLGFKPTNDVKLTVIKGEPRNAN